MEAKKPRYLKLTFEEDLKDRTYKVVFLGPWNNLQMEKMFRLIRKNLRLHKHTLRKKDEEAKRKLEKARLEEEKRKLKEGGKSDERGREK